MNEQMHTLVASVIRSALWILTGPGPESVADAAYTDGFLFLLRQVAEGVVAGDFASLDELEEHLQSVAVDVQRDDELSSEGTEKITVKGYLDAIAGVQDVIEAIQLHSVASQN